MLQRCGSGAASMGQRADEKHVEKLTFDSMRSLYEMYNTSGSTRAQHVHVRPRISAQLGPHEVKRVRETERNQFYPGVGGAH